VNCSGDESSQDGGYDFRPHQRDLRFMDEIDMSQGSEKNGLTFVSTEAWYFGPTYFYVLKTNN